MSLISEEIESMVDTIEADFRDMPTTGEPEPKVDSTRDVLLDSVVPRFHTTRDVAASAMSLDFLSPPLTSTSTGTKRSATMIPKDSAPTLSSTLYKDLTLTTTGPSRASMQCIFHQTCRSTVSNSSLPIHLVESIWKYPSIEVHIP